MYLMANWLVCDALRVAQSQGAGEREPPNSESTIRSQCIYFSQYMFRSLLFCCGVFFSSKTENRCNHPEKWKIIFTRHYLNLKINFPFIGGSRYLYVCLFVEDSRNSFSLPLYTRLCQQNNTKEQTKQPIKWANVMKIHSIKTSEQQKKMQ